MLLLAFLVGACVEPLETEEASTGERTQPLSGDSVDLLFEETRRTSKGTFTFSAVVGDDGRSKLVALSSEGKVAPWDEAVDFGLSPVASDAILALAEEGVRGSVWVDIWPRDDLDSFPIHEEWGRIDHEHGRAWINGKEVSSERITESNRRLEAAFQEIREAKVRNRREILRNLIAREGWKIPLEHIEEIAATNEALRIELELGDLEKLGEQNRDLIGAIDLVHEITNDSLATAMASTWVNPGAHGLGLSGAGIGIYMTEYGCPPDGYLPNYTRLGGSDDDHARNVSAITRAVAPGSYLYCRNFSTLPSSTDLSDPGPGGGPPIRIITRSSGSTANSGYDSADREWDNFIINSGIPGFKSAGNTGATGNLSSPGKGLNVLAIGNYVDSRNEISIDSSSRNPTNTRNFKPDFVAPGTSINAGTNSSGGTIIMSGTSQAAPHAAGIAALLMEASPVHQGRPHLVAATLLRGARNAVTGGFERVGMGGIDYNKVHHDGWSEYWQGDNDSFASWDAADPIPGNGSIDRYIHLPAGGGVYRIVLVYSTRGTWTYDHRNDTFPIGRGLTFSVYKPDGSLIASASNLYSGIEFIEFKASGSGNYLIRIFDHWNNDLDAPLLMAMSMGFKK